MFPIYTHRKYIRMERPKIVRDKCTRVVLNNSSTNHCADVNNVRLSTSKLKNKGKLSCQHPTRNPLPTSALTRLPQRSTWQHLPVVTQIPPKMNKHQHLRSLLLTKPTNMHYYISLPLNLPTRNQRHRLPSLLPKKEANFLQNLHLPSLPLLQATMNHMLLGTKRCCYIKKVR